MNTVGGVSEPSWVRRKAGRPRVPQSIVDEWRRLHCEEGWSIRGIARYFGYAPSTVWRHLNGYYDEKQSTV